MKIPVAQRLTDLEAQVVLGEKKKVLREGVLHSGLHSAGNLPRDLGLSLFLFKKIN